MKKKIIILAGIIILITILLTLTYKFGLNKFQKADLCDWLHSDSTYSVKTWEDVQFHLPTCWYYTTGENSLHLKNDFGANNPDELSSLDFYLKKIDPEYELTQSIEIGEKKYDEYTGSGFNTYYKPTWIEKEFYIAMPGAISELSPYHPSMEEYEMVLISITELNRD